MYFFFFAKHSAVFSWLVNLYYVTTKMAELQVGILKKGF